MIFHQTSDDGYLTSLMPRIPELLFCVMRTGYVAVGVFFVLSGFVLSYAHEPELCHRWSWRESRRFLYNRFARIYPGYVVGLMLVMPIVGFELAKSHVPVDKGKESVTALLNWTLLQTWIPSMAASWNGPAWSLSNEAFFYLTFPIVGVWLWKITRKREVAFVSLALWASGLVGPMIAVLLPIHGFGNVPATSPLADADPFWSNFFKYYPLLHLPDFCIGIAAGKLFRILRNEKSSLAGRGYLIYGPALILELMVLFEGNRIPYPLLHNALLLPLHGALILGLALSGRGPVRVLSNSAVVFLGHASYAMYIIHLPFSIWLNFVIRPFLPGRPSGVPVMLAYLVLVICLASLQFRWIEQPANKILKTWFRRDVTPAKI
jgi:peptidoglycan/LPS O-acetylase OafA/YrhL